MVEEIGCGEGRVGLMNTHRMPGGGSAVSLTEGLQHETLVAKGLVAVCHGIIDSPERRQHPRHPNGAACPACCVLFSVALSTSDNAQFRVVVDGAAKSRQRMVVLVAAMEEEPE